MTTRSVSNSITLTLMGQLSTANIVNFHRFDRE